MRIRFILVAALFAVTPMLCASQDAPRVVNVKAESRGEMPVRAPEFIMSAACDETGNVYTQLFSKDTIAQTTFYQAPVQKITPEVKSAGEFRFSDAFSDGAEGRAFFVHDGRLYVLATAKQGGHYVVEFANDGSIKAPVKLQTDFYWIPFHFAVFPSGEYLVVGLTGTIGKTTPHLHTPFTAVFAADGRLVKKIYEPEDEDARQRAEGGDSLYGRYINSGNEFIGWDADVTSGSDGNVYLLHGFSPSLIYVISPKGDVVRKLQIDAGNPELAANSIKFHAGRLAVGYSWLGDAPQNLIRVIDLEGNSIADYEVREGPKDSDPILACYNSEGFTLIPRGADTKLHLLVAKVR